MEQLITFAELNDFIFCPMSLYFHSYYIDFDDSIYKSTFQTNGSYAHSAVDENRYSSRKNVLQGTSLYCEKYNLVGKLDTFYIDEGKLVERKKKVKQIFDGYLFQTYAQYFSLLEMGFKINSIEVYSIDDHKHYKIKLPYEDKEMFEKFESVINEINNFDYLNFNQTNIQKCKNCIYNPLCGGIDVK
ncbi:type V CRISPR-associated protein Cas4 [Helcococcus ovis]|uniref:type V CRISPR-associated protein Cas4 n=1 Tax=Helcococcus ovis TaxID=72026 RepID=UPI0038B82525